MEAIRDIRLHKPMPRVMEREIRRKQIESARRAAYKSVDVRDQMRCRGCGQKLKSTLTVCKEQAEHHHIDGRQVQNAETTANICLLCRVCHAARHVTRTLSITGDADVLLTFEHAGKVWYSGPGQKFERHARSWQRD